MSIRAIAQQAPLRLSQRLRFTLARLEIPIERRYQLSGADIHNFPLLATVEGQPATMAFHPRITRIFTKRIRAMYG